jgi:hypothetical protein
MSAFIDVTDAEASFLEMMREGEDFTLTISCKAGHWILAMESPGIGGPPARARPSRRLGTISSRGGRTELESPMSADIPEDNWAALARAKGFRCSACGMPTAYDERDLYFRTSRCPPCAEAVSKDKATYVR